MLGADHPHTLATRNNLASWRSQAGDPAGAVTAFEQLLDDYLRVLGADHPHTLATRNNLAYWRSQAGDPVGAATAFEQLLTDLLRVLGADHPHTLITRNNLAHLQHPPPALIRGNLSYQLEGLGKRTGRGSEDGGHADPCTAHR
nr:hypothetical protein GCM10020092_088520 [Actinoplanes digitatis]